MLSAHYFDLEFGYKDQFTLIKIILLCMQNDELTQKCHRIMQDNACIMLLQVECTT